ncbi:MAG: hypothetical protein CYG60_02595, partial [Actinobacteria bacterium]
MERVYRKTSDNKEKGRIVEVNGGGFVVPSFTTEGVSYKTHPDSGYCSCERHFHTGLCRKHVAFAESVAAIREREAKTRRFLPVLARIAEEKALRLCKELWGPVRRGESATESYELLLKVMSFRFASDGMRRQAHRRHG